MRNHRIVSSIIACLISILLMLLPVQAAAAQIPQPAAPSGQPTNQPTQPAIPAQTYAADGQQLLSPDWSQITFGSLPGVTQPGWVSLPPSITNQLGYDPSRSWPSGANLAQFMELGDFQDSFHLEAFNLNQISQISGLQAGSLQTFPLAGIQTPATLLQAIPSLGQLPVSSVQPIADLFELAGQNPSETIAQAVQQFPQIAQQPLSQLDLSNYGVNSIPGLSNAPLGNLAGWQQSFINQVPGLSQVPFSQFPQTPGAGVGLRALADVVFGKAEHGDPNVRDSYFVSGTGGPHDGSTKPVACDVGKPCAYLELSDLSGSTGQFHGKRWASGETQLVLGGYGLLGQLNGGKEPTGRLVFGPAFKVVITKTDETTGTVQFGLYFRVCAGAAGCSPYFIGPVPWIGTQEKGMVILTSATPPKINIPESIQQQLAQYANQYTGNIASNCTTTGGGGVASGDAVNRAIAAAPAALQSYAQKSVPEILAAAIAQGVTDPAQIAYILATVEAETSMGAAVVENQATRAYSTRSSSNPYYGRGYSQLTHEANYAKASQHFGVDFVRNPELAASPQYSAPILVWGMKTGAFTGLSLNDYIGGGRTDFANARSIVNDSDKKYQIGQDAQRYYAALQGSNIAALNTTGGSQVVTTCVAPGAPGETNAPITAGAINQRILQAAQQSFGESTAAGPDGGNLACAWEVNRVLRRAGIAPIDGDSVPNMVSIMQSGRGQQIAQSSAQPGDIVIAHDQAHVGICMNAGCSKILSNSSSRASFQWQSDGNFDGVYGGANYGVFRVTQ